MVMFLTQMVMFLTQMLRFREDANAFAANAIKQLGQLRRDAEHDASELNTALKRTSKSKLKEINNWKNISPLKGGGAVVEPKKGISRRVPAIEEEITAASSLVETDTGGQGMFWGKTKPVNSMRLVEGFEAKLRETKEEKANPKTTKRGNTELFAVGIEVTAAVATSGLFWTEDTSR